MIIQVIICLSFSVAVTLIYTYGVIAFPKAEVYEDQATSWKLIVQLSTSGVSFFVLNVGLIFEQLVDMQIKKSKPSKDKLSAEPGIGRKSETARQSDKDPSAPGTPVMKGRNPPGTPVLNGRPSEKGRTIKMVHQQNTDTFTYGI